MLHYAECDVATEIFDAGLRRVPCSSHWQRLLLTGEVLDETTPLLAVRALALHGLLGAYNAARAERSGRSCGPAHGSRLWRARAQRVLVARPRLQQLVREFLR